MEERHLLASVPVLAVGVLRARGVPDQKAAATDLSEAFG